MSPRNPLRRGTQGALTADELTARADALATATGAHLAWVPRRSGERGGIEAGLLPDVVHNSLLRRAIRAIGQCAIAIEAASLGAFGFRVRGALVLPADDRVAHSRLQRVGRLNATDGEKTAGHGALAPNRGVVRKPLFIWVM